MDHVSRWSVSFSSDMALARARIESRWDEAKESFEQSLAIHEENAEGWLGLGRVSMALEDDDAAERHYKR